MLISMRPTRKLMNSSTVLARRQQAAAAARTGKVKFQQTLHAALQDVSMACRLLKQLATTARHDNTTTKNEPLSLTVEAPRAHAHHVSNQAGWVALHLVKNANLQQQQQQQQQQRLRVQCSAVVVTAVTVAAACSNTPR
jgi:hypothetical protein